MHSLYFSPWPLTINSHKARYEAKTVTYEIPLVSVPCVLQEFSPFTLESHMKTRRVKTVRLVRTCHRCTKQKLEVTKIPEQKLNNAFISS